MNCTFIVVRVYIVSLNNVLCEIYLNQSIKKGLELKYSHFADDWAAIALKECFHLFSPSAEVIIK